MFFLETSLNCSFLVFKAPNKNLFAVKCDTCCPFITFLIKMDTNYSRFICYTQTTISIVFSICTAAQIAFSVVVAVAIFMIDILIWAGVHHNSMEANNASNPSIVIAACQITAFIDIPVGTALHDVQIFNIEVELGRSNI